MDKFINALSRLWIKKIKFRRYVFHNDKRQAEAKVNVQHFIKAPNNEIAINNDIRVYKNINQESDSISASV